MPHTQQTSESVRLAALYSYDILDTPRESDFDDIVSLAATLCGAPISVINLIASDRQWFKAEVGLGIRETPLDVSICKHVLLQPGLTVIEDLRDDQRMCANPLVCSDDGLRFYAGYLLQTPQGQGIGTLCILDRTPRDLDQTQRQALKILASQVMAQLALRKTLRLQTELARKNEMLLAEVNHRTKNNLQLISSLVQLQHRRASHPEARSDLLDLSRRITSIASAHEHLAVSADGQNVDAAAYVKSVVDSARATAPGLQFDVALQPARLMLDSAQLVALVANEMITNAMKYAYDPGTDGVISVSMGINAGRLYLTVADQGKGLPNGFEPLKRRSMGMTIMRSLANQLEGRLSIKPANPGLSCSLVFDLPLSTGEP